MRLKRRYQAVHWPVAEVTDSAGDMRDDLDEGSSEFRRTSACLSALLDMNRHCLYKPIPTSVVAGLSPAEQNRRNTALEGGPDPSVSSRALEMLDVLYEARQHCEPCVKRRSAMRAMVQRATWA
jgi:hypothetical protein